MDLGHSDGSGNGIRRLFLLLVRSIDTSQGTLRWLLCQCDDEAEKVACIAAVLMMDVNNILCEHVVKERVGQALSLKVFFEVQIAYLEAIAEFIVCQGNQCPTESECCAQLFPHFLMYRHPTRIQSQGAL